MVISNDTIQYILDRSSIRAYQSQPLNKERIDLLKQSVLAAPTARNRQQLRYAFVTDQSIIEQIDARIFHYCDKDRQKMMEERNSSR